MQSSSINSLKHTLRAHHKNVVQQFHHKHAEALHRAKRQYISLAGAAIVTASALGTNQLYQNELIKVTHQQEMAKTHEFVKYIKKLLSDKKQLNPDEEQVLAQALSKDFGLNLTANLQGHHLNEIVGYMGAEQHLKRWNGDNLAQHDFQKVGMAPLQGSFKDFDNAEQEKYYVAVQLHELPDWNANWSVLKPWYRYRKVFVFNPENQRGIVAVIGDSGPSKFTGKTFGGSPELMQYLDMKDGSQKGKAIILFVDDPNDKIALGPANSSTADELAGK